MSTQEFAIATHPSDKKPPMGLSSRRVVQSNGWADGLRGAAAGPFAT